MNKSITPFLVGVAFLSLVGVILLSMRPAVEENKEGSREISLQTQIKEESIPETAKNLTVNNQTNSNEAITIEVVGTNFAFSPKEIKVKKGNKVVIRFINKEGFHDFVIDEFNIKTKQINAGQQDVAEFTADKTGTFEYYCSIGSHRKMGMVGKLIVE